MRSLTILLSFGALAAGGGCSSDSGHGDDGESYNCAAEKRDDEFVAGLEKTGVNARMTFKLVSAVPAPPARGDNEWVLQISTMPSAAPVSGAALLVTPFMPDHQHGTPLPVEIEAMTPGQYKLLPVNMWMPGLWETTIEVNAGTLDGDTAVFKFCIPS